MVLLKNPHQIFDYEDLQESLFEMKEADCILSSEDGIEIDIHKEILFQTKFMQSILLGIENSCCNNIQIFCPCPAHELEDLVKFLYSGKMIYNTDTEREKLSFIKMLKHPTNLGELTEVFINPPPWFAFHMLNNSV